MRAVSAARLQGVHPGDRGPVGDIEGLRRDHDVVIMDRYVASNAAYTAALEAT
ncbi:hypothetical protein MAHJHV60_45900 [Mycobacterium avium subsp. hominissuis]